MKQFDLITPEGTRDLLFEECLKRREVEKKLAELFGGYGYSEVVTPGIEFFDVFNKSSYFPQESLYKLTDTKGRLIAMRPDSTVPIARIVASRLRDSRLPLRLYYNQNIYSVTRSLTGRSDEIVQAGIELIGSDSKIADIEVLAIAIEALNAFDKNFRLEIGDIGFFKELVMLLDVSDTVREEIRHLTEMKNYPALNDLLDDIGNTEITNALKQLPRLFGGEDVFEKASELFSNSKIDAILYNLKSVFKQLASLGLNENITVDLATVNKIDYYTGIVFRGYIQGYGESVLSGGRYDRLIAEFGYEIPAIGFGINVDAVATMLRRGDKSSETTNEIIVFAQKDYEIKAIQIAQNLISEGKTVEVSLEDVLENALKYMKENGINELISVGESIEKFTLKGGAENG